MTIADGGDRPSSVEELPWSRPVVVLRLALRLRAREQAAVEHTRGDDADAALLAEGEEVVEAFLLEQCVAPRKHHDVHVRLTYDVGEHRRLVHPRADGVHDALVAQFGERRVAGLEDFYPVLIGVVEVNDVDPIEAEPLQALRERATYPVAAE